MGRPYSEFSSGPDYPTPASYRIGVDEDSKPNWLVKMFWRRRSILPFGARKQQSVSSLKITKRSTLLLPQCTTKVY